MPIALHAGVSIAFTALLLTVFVRAGLLGLVMAWLIFQVIVFCVPWALDPSRWYFWRGAVVFFVLLAVPWWGFRNALGKQSAFPAGEEE